LVHKTEPKDTKQQQQQNISQRVHKMCKELHTNKDLLQGVGISGACAEL